MKELKLIIRILIIVLLVLFSLSFLAMVVVCIAMMASYWGERMGNEASGFFNAALMLTLFIGIITYTLWIIFLKQRKKGDTK